MSFDTSEDRTLASGAPSSIRPSIPLSPEESLRRSLLSCEVRGYELNDFDGHQLLSQDSQISVETGKVLIATKLITDCDLLDAMLAQEGYITAWKQRRQSAVETAVQCIIHWAFGSKTKPGKDIVSQLVKDIRSTFDAALRRKTRASGQADRCTFNSVLLAFQEHTEQGLGEPCLIEQQVSEGEGNINRQYDSPVSFKAVWESLLHDQVRHLRRLDQHHASELVNTIVAPVLQAATEFSTDFGGSRRAEDEITEYWLANAGVDLQSGDETLGTGSADP